MVGLCEGGNEPPGSLKASYIRYSDYHILSDGRFWNFVTSGCFHILRLHFKTFFGSLSEPLHFIDPAHMSEPVQRRRDSSIYFYQLASVKFRNKTLDIYQKNTAELQCRKKKILNKTVSYGATSFVGARDAEFVYIGRLKRTMELLHNNVGTANSQVFH
ncbi:hypothetical protein ANN_01890 [Periplaneta americana]|uniref:Uncharacterized protein n=1 Tax=Periplaneta americana TaxID=6978 RepID=A0ABQ8TYX5_PERAM|nr:hypothetical protein ANN_01890 [Periplaneta americana]